MTKLRTMKHNYLRKIFIKVTTLTLAIIAFNASSDKITERTDWGQYFERYSAKGTIVILDARNNVRQTYVYNKDRANEQFSPASTFKIPHTLFALDAGVVEDEFQVFAWDGVKRNFAAHNQDQTLRSAMQNSAVWVYNIFSKKLGEEKARNYLKKTIYGNADPSSDNGSYWLDGKLGISSFEQISFLEKLYRNTLPFRFDHQRLVKDIIIVEAGKNWILRAKSGWQGRFGWWVGWVETSNGPVFFALNIDTPNRLKDLHKREAIVRDILYSLNALIKR